MGENDFESRGVALLAEERARVLVLGCGNVLWGDDGFGPEVLREMASRDGLPGDVACVNAGTGSRTLLFDLVLSARKPKRLVVVDSMEFGAPPGTVASLDLESLPAIKIDDFSMHQAPASNLLRELRDHCGVQVVLVACQPAEIPQEVRPGLSATVREAVPRAIRVVREWCAPEEDPG